MPSLLANMRSGNVATLPGGLAIALVSAFVLSLMRAAFGPPAFKQNSPIAIFSSPLVSPAPAPAFDTASLISNFSDARGSYVRASFQKTEISGPLYQNLIYTRQGFYRSGDLHMCTQVNTMVTGRAELITIDSGGLEKRQAVLAGETVTTQPGIPHLFHFLAENSIMSEHWIHASNGSLCEYQAWFYKPFRDIITKQMAGVRAEFGITTSQANITGSEKD
jgi:hypothetical protein